MISIIVVSLYSGSGSTRGSPKRLNYSPEKLKNDIPEDWNLQQHLCVSETIRKG
jgi:hypothetical protein